MSRYEHQLDELVLVVLEIIIFPLYAGAFLLPIAGAGSMIFQHEYRVGIIYLLGAIVSYSLSVAISGYFDFKKHKPE